MKVKVITLQNWCSENVTPLAWQRIVIKILPQLRDKGFDLNDLEKPSDDRFFQDAEFKIFENTLSEVYDISFPKKVIE